MMSYTFDPSPIYSAGETAAAWAVVALIFALLACFRLRHAIAPRRRGAAFKPCRAILPTGTPEAEHATSGPSRMRTTNLQSDMDAARNDRIATRVRPTR